MCQCHHSTLNSRWINAEGMDRTRSSSTVAGGFVDFPGFRNSATQVWVAWRNPRVWDMLWCVFNRKSTDVHARVYSRISARIGASPLAPTETRCAPNNGTILVCTLETRTSINKALWRHLASTAESRICSVVPVPSSFLFRFLFPLFHQRGATVLSSSGFIGPAP